MPPTASTIDVRFGCDAMTIPWSERHRAIDVARNMVTLHVPQLAELLQHAVGGDAAAADQRFKVFVEVATRHGTFVCCDVEQLEQTLSIWGSTGTNQVSLEVVVLAALQRTGDGDAPAIRKLYRKDLALLQGCIAVALEHSGEVVGHCRFDRTRPPTLTELEDAVDALPWAARHRSNGGAPTRMGWRTVAADGSSKEVGPTMEIDGEADMKALCADVRSFGLDGIQLCLQLVGGVGDGAYQGSTAAGSAVTAQQILKGTRPSSAAAAAGTYRGSATTSTPQQFVGPRKAVAPTVRPLSPAAARSTMEDDDADYVAISYVLNPPVITVVAFMEEAQLTALCNDILNRCVTSARIAAMRSGPPTFVRAPRNVGVFPVYTLSLPRSYFDEIQEMALSITILDSMSSFGSFRYVPLDGSCEREGFNSVQAQREKSKMLLNLGGARAANDLTGDRQPSKRSAQFFFVPK